MRTVFFQITSTFTVLFAVYLIYATFEPVEAETLQVINFLVFQPLNAIIASGVTVAGCFIVGLPLRLNEKINHWWKGKPSFAVSGSIIGIACLFLALNINLTETKQMVFEGEPTNYEVPNVLISTSGWFLLAFCLLHLYPSSLRNLFRR